MCWRRDGKASGRKAVRRIAAAEHFSQLWKIPRMLVDITTATV